MSTKKTSTDSDESALSKLNEDQTEKTTRKPDAEDSGSSVISKINDDPKE